MVFWMIEFTTLKEDAKKEHLEGVIEPKNYTLSQPYLEDRIKAL